jgi:hypothetical protein
MANVPRVFVGTMHCGEGDYPECVKAVENQRGVDVTHIVIADLPEREAHNRLWQAWRDAKNDHDLFVKVDADTVLRSPDTLRLIYEQFFHDPRVTGLQAPLHDYMTDRHINGLNAFSPRVTFNDTKDDLFCDRAVDTGHDVVLRGGLLPLDLVPAGYHCHHASEIQGFHYGVHRMLKGQVVTLDQVFNAWTRYHDRVRLFALVGAHMSIRFVNNRRYNYTDPEFKEAYNETVAQYDELAQHYKALVKRP